MNKTTLITQTRTVWDAGLKVKIVPSLAGIHAIKPAWVLLLLLLLESTTLFGVAQPYYVSPGGADGNPGTQALPFATIGRGMDEIQPGDTLYIGAGVYYEGEFYPAVNGSPATPITIRNVTGEMPVLDGQFTLWNFVELIEKDGFVFEGLTLRHYKSGCISSIHSGYVTVRKCVAYQNGSGGIEMNFADYPHASYDSHMIVEDCVCFENGWGDGWASGIHLNNKSEGGIDSHHIIRRNICYNNYDGSDYHSDGNGIMFDMGGGGSAQIENNLCYNNGGAGIRVMDGSATIVNNTCYRNGWDVLNDYQPPEIELIERHLSGATHDVTVRNNIIWARGQREFEGMPYGGIFSLDGVDIEDFVFDHNLIWSDVEAEVLSETWMSTCYTGAASFGAVSSDDSLVILNGCEFLEMDASGYDFRLRSGSIGIDQGSLDGAPDDDLEGQERPFSSAPDIGAYENTTEPAMVNNWDLY